MLESGPPVATPEPEADPDLEFDDPLPFSEVEIKPAAKGSPRSRPIPDPFPWGTDQPLREDLEATRLVADSASGARYVLQFSTGESVTVGGSGLVGRNPSMQPGEYVDQLVPIFDAGKSVSKTHLEFGQEAGPLLGQRPLLDERLGHPAARRRAAALRRRQAVLHRARHPR